MLEGAHRQTSTLEVDGAMTEMLVSIPWGHGELELDSGESLTIPKQVLQAKRSHVIVQYKCHCEELNFTPLRDRKLFYILENLNASEQKALSGLDDFAVAARDAWEKLEFICQKFLISSAERKRLISRIKKSSQYLKSRFRIHCSVDPIASHCTVYCLSQETKDKPECSHDHTLVCEVCVALAQLLDGIEENITILTDKEIKDELTYDFEQSRDVVVEQSRHIVHSVQQNIAKANDIKNLSDDSAYMTIDWAQKILRIEHREGQSKYFGKKGMFVLVGSFTMINPEMADSCKTKTYMLALPRCPQTELDTLSGGHLIATEFAKRHPQIKKLLKRSGNTCVLGGHAMPESERILHSKTGLELLVRDYLEVQSGKDVCDRMTDSAKMRCKASGIGDRLFIPYSNPSVKPNMKLIKPFEPAPTTISRRLNDNKRRSEPRKDRQYNIYYFCPVDNCTKVFQSKNELLDTQIYQH
ncbi:unnamed protein product [Didymodactylos carnosus]|uniref:C2H2-type domain-containing protein n=1 Tax=Didymodactylos carnosus TaxID=1234261 RepID=A0A815BVS5_9BILA|nr:unnamed protein product [Didymodactylos carnosus]CAF1275220.1 unnamed protein product [Didymodactylos carnosus]CAF3905824.1 unnamed protein product [Didymodactylos carnosus]CAF4065987.1 unnamed protein product [Didymodactylos carnosus]